MKTWNVIVLLAVVCLTVVPAGNVEGGTVFLKNGYVIQGQITASDDTRVVVNWNNGSTTIYRRFIDEVILDASEEAAIASRHEALAQVVVPEARERGRIEPVLPESISSFFPEYERVSEDSLATDSQVSEEAQQSSEEVAVEVVPQRVTIEALGFSVILPAGWTVDESAGGVRFYPSDPSVGWLAVDRYVESTVEIEFAIAGLTQVLEKNGFSTGISDDQVLMEVPGSEATLSGRELNGNRRCTHALTRFSNAIYLFGWYQ